MSFFIPKNSLKYFFQSLQYSYLQRSLLAVTLVGVVCGLIGVFIILKGLSFFGAGIAHSCFAGGALALLISTNPFLTILLFGEGSAFIIGYINEKNKSKENDTAVGIMFSFTMALAVLFVALNRSYSTNIQSLLFGNALLITSESLIQLIIVVIIVMILFILMKKEFLAITFDEEMAKVLGIPVRVLNYIFLAIIAAVITVSLKAIGAILVFAMIVTPAAAAYQWTYKVNKMLILAGIFGGISGIIGVVLSFLYDIPTGASIVILVTLIFGISFIISPKRKTPQLYTSEDQDLHLQECNYCKESAKAEDCPYCEEETILQLNPESPNDQIKGGHQHE